MSGNRKTPRQKTGTPAIEGVEGVEIKVTVRPSEELRSLRALELDEDSAEVRIIYFYDTVELDLYDSGVVLRARLVKGDDDDSTVKIRPVEPGRSLQAGPGWQASRSRLIASVVASSAPPLSRSGKNAMKLTRWLKVSARSPNSSRGIKYAF